MAGSGNHMVDEHDEELRRESREGNCPHCGSNKTYQEGYCSETMDHCEDNCQEMIDDHNQAERPEGEAFKPIEPKAYLKCEFYKEREVCGDCCKPTGRDE